MTEDSIAGDDDPLSPRTLRRSQGRLATGLRQPGDPSELAIGQKMRSDQQTMKIQIMHQQSPVPEQSAETIDSLRLTAHRQSSVSQYDPQKLGYGPMYALPEREKSTNLPSAQKTIDNAIMRIASGKRITEVSSQIQQDLSTIDPNRSLESHRRTSINSPGRVQESFGMSSQ